MLNEHIVKCSTTIKEYDQLNEKMRKISQVAQKMFTLSLLTDKLEKEKYSDLVKEKVIELSKMTQINKN
jgi:GTPase Era involved in 16S rRNA processing